MKETTRRLLKRAWRRFTIRLLAYCSIAIIIAWMQTLVTPQEKIANNNNHQKEKTIETQKDDNKQKTLPKTEEPPKANLRYGLQASLTRHEGVEICSWIMDTTRITWENYPGKQECAIPKNTQFTLDIHGYLKQEDEGLRTWAVTTKHAENVYTEVLLGDDNHWIAYMDGFKILRQTNICEKGWIAVRIRHTGLAGNKVEIYVDISGKTIWATEDYRNG